MPGNRGVPAFASGRSIVVSSEFIRSEQKGEAVGCVIHEITHIAQNSDWGRGNRRRVPGWDAWGNQIESDAVWEKPAAAAPAADLFTPDSDDGGAKARSSDNLSGGEV